MLPKYAYRQDGTPTQSRELTERIIAGIVVGMINAASFLLRPIFRPRP